MTHRILRVGTLSPVPGFRPEEAMADAPAQVADLVYEAPFRHAVRGAAPAPALLEALGRVDGDRGGVELLACLRAGARFSDGTPVTADDVVRCLRAAPRLAPGEWVSESEGRVRFRLPVDDPALLAKLSASTFAVARGAGPRPLGTGPYRVADESSPEHVRLLRNPWAATDATADEIHFVAFSAGDDGVARLAAALQSGAIDVTVALPPEEARALEGVSLAVEPGASTAILFLNTERPALADPAVRRAIAMALDRPEIASVGQASPEAFVARSLLPPCFGIESAHPIVHDPDAARRVVEEAGLHGTQLRMITPWGPRMYLADPWGAGEAIAMQLANLGLAVDAVPASSPREALDIVRARDYDMMLAGWSADTPDAADYLDALLHSAAIPERGRPLMISCNLARLDDPEVDAALARFRGDPRTETLASLERRVAEHAALVPLCHGDVTIVCGPRVRELPLMPSNMPDYRRIRLG